MVYTSLQLHLGHFSAQQHFPNNLQGGANFFFTFSSSLTPRRQPICLLAFIFSCPYTLLKRIEEKMFKAPNPYDEVVIKATDENLTSENWQLNLDVCDKVTTEGSTG